MMSDPQRAQALLTSKDIVIPNTLRDMERDLRKSSRREDDFGVESWISICRRQISTNFENIFQYSESPIETTLLCSLNVLCSRTFPTALRVLGPSKDAIAELNEFRECVNDTLGWKEAFKKHKHKYGVDTFEAFMELPVRDGVLTPEQSASIQSDVLLHESLWFFSSIHLALQPRFPDVLVNDKPVRTDAFAFIPTNPKLLMVIECDGYETHSNKDSFTSDRQRDRAFAEKGISVRRYSGSEIFRNPVQCAFDLFDCLLNFIPERKRANGKSK